MCGFRNGREARYEVQMQIKKKPTAVAVAVAYLAWEIVLQPIWNLNLERLAERQSIDTALADGGGIMDAFRAAAEYVPSSFGLGFVVGGLLFAYWDVVTANFRAHGLRKSEADLRAWVGNMVPHFDVEKKGYAEIYIYLIGVGTTPFRINGVKGNILLTHDNGKCQRVKTKLPTPSISNNPTDDRPLEAGHHCLLILSQPVPKAVTSLLPDIFGYNPYPHFDFDDLNITLTSLDGRASKRLKLWESMRLSSGDGQVRSVQAIKMFQSAEEATRFTESMAGLLKFFSDRRS